MINIIPEPNAKHFDYDKKINFKKIEVKGEIVQTSKNELLSFVEKNSQYEVGVDDFAIIFEKVDNNKHKEWHKIVVENNTMTVFANCDEGHFRAIQTVKQLLSQQLFEGEIEDYPQNDFRSFMLDVGRYYYKVSDILKIIEYFSALKFNVFHFHLTEDQGWRFESEKYPKLTQIGSYRSHTNFNHKPESGFYTKEELKFIVDICHKKFIKVIPEIDMPGHTMSALASYPELSCFDRELKVATHWGVKFDIMCAGKESTYKFCFDIIDELCEIFTDEYIHIGGDEAPKKRWELCEHCNAKLKELGLSNMQQLQFYFANRLAEYAQSKGKKVIMWDIEFPKNCDINLSKDVICEWWGTNKNTEIVDKMKDGRKIITANSGAYYIDLPYGYISLKDSYCQESIKGIEDNKQIFGYETCLWTEYVKDLKKAQFNTFPRVFAISEVFWNANEKMPYEDFLKKLTFAREYILKYDVDMVKANVYNPSKLRAFFSKMWFERRQLTWQGIYLNVDNAILKHKVKKQRKNK